MEKQFESLLEGQQRGASGQRLEMLQRDLTGTKRLLEAALWPVLKSFEGLVLEYEMVSITGVRIYGDVWPSLHPIQLGRLGQKNGSLPAGGI